MKPILCVIDLTESALVLEVAARIAYAHKSPLAILFPYRLINDGFKGEISRLKSMLEQEGRDKFLSLKKQISLLDHVSYDFQPEI